MCLFSLLTFVGASCAMENDKQGSKNNKPAILLQKDQLQNNKKTIQKSEPADVIFIVMGIMTIAGLTANFVAACTHGNIQPPK